LATQTGTVKLIKIAPVAFMNDRPILVATSKKHMDNIGDTIFIVGRGAIGKALAVFLTLNKKRVVLLRGTVDDGSHSTEDMQVTLNDGTALKAAVEVTTLNAFSDLRGMVVLTNKSFGNKDLATSLKKKISASPVVLLQNGLGVEQPFIGNNFPAVYRCVLFVTSQNLDDHSVRFKPVSACPIGVVKGNEADLDQVTTTLTTQYCQFRNEVNIDVVVWRKAIINCAFNSICPLLDIDNGIFHRDPQVLAIAKRVINECLVVARMKGISLNADEVVENLLLISRSSDGQLISTLQDIRKGLPTEIDTLNFEIARIAKEFGIENQVKETSLLGELTKLKADAALSVKF
jgi:2-dehydropantoate 2-reductase